MKRSRKNLFGFGKSKPSPKKRAAKRSALTVSEAAAAAFAAGKKVGDTGKFSAWLESKGLENRSPMLRDRLKKEFERGVLAPEEEERKRRIDEKVKAEAKRIREEVEAEAAERRDQRRIASGKRHYQRKGDKYVQVNPPRIIGTYAVRSTAEKVARLQKGTIKPKGRKFQVWSNPGKSAFKRCVKEVAAKGEAYDPYAVCAAAGRKKYGAKKFAAMAQAGKRAKKRAANPLKLATVRQGKAKAEIFAAGVGKYRVMITRGSDRLEETLKSFKGAMAFARVRLHDIASNPLGTLEAYYLARSFGPMAARAADKTVSVARKVGSKAYGAVKHTLRKNPISQAEKTFEEFHGIPPQEVLEYQTQEHYHSVTASIGRLICLQLIDVNGKPLDIICDGFTWHGPKSELARGKKMSRDSGWDFDPSTPVADVTMLTTSEDGKQLFVQGGNQELDVKALGFDERDEHDHMLLGTIWRLWYQTRKSFEADGEQDVSFYHELGKEGSREVCPVLIYKPRNPSFEIAGGRYYIAPPESELGGVSPGIVG